ncbi:MAG: efflux RND transporter periplasmic adaptor subunit [Isosphaeraceae bacterium]
MRINSQSFLKIKRLLALATVLGLACGLSPSGRSLGHVQGLSHVPVRRALLPVTIVAAGRLESSVQTVIRCEMENVAGRRWPDGRSASAAIIEIALEGTKVRKGDVLCRLDASQHEEMARRQRIVVLQCQVLHRRAQLDLETARAAVKEYFEGLCTVQSRDLQGQLALADADVARLADRVSWSQRMFDKGYVSRARLADDTAALQRANIKRQQIQRELRNFEKFESVDTRRSLESAVATARNTLTFQTLKLQAEEKRLADLELQVARSVIRAPHDGIVVLAHKPKRGVRIEEGLWVRRKQPIILLPDWARLEVQVEIHEQLISRVRPGMKVQVRLESGGEQLDGELESIDFLPLVDQATRHGIDIKRYLGHVRLDRAPRDPRLGMTAEVTIEAGVREGALVIPYEALGTEGSDHFCDVLNGSGIERRQVTVGEVTPLLLEVTRGLKENEEVMLLGKRRPTGRQGVSQFLPTHEQLPDKEAN